MLCGWAKAAYICVKDFVGISMCVCVCGGGGGGGGNAKTVHSQSLEKCKGEIIHQLTGLPCSPLIPL